MNIPSLPSNLESSTLFLNKFSCASEEISRNYRPAMNIHNDRTLRIRGHVYSRRGRVWMSRDGFNWISNRKRIVKTRFGYALFEGRCFAKRQGGRRDVCVRVFLARCVIIVTIFSSCDQDSKETKEKCSSIWLIRFVYSYRLIIMMQKRVTKIWIYVYLLILRKIINWYW